MITVVRSLASFRSERTAKVLRHTCRRRAVEQAAIDKARCRGAADVMSRHDAPGFGAWHDHHALGGSIFSQYFYRAAPGHFRESNTQLGGVRVGKHTHQYSQGKAAPPSVHSLRSVAAAADHAPTADGIGRCGVWVRRSFRQLPRNCSGKTKTTRSGRKCASPCRVSGPLEYGAGK